MAPLYPTTEYAAPLKMAPLYPTTEYAALLKMAPLYPTTEYAALLKRYIAILNSLVSADMDYTQLDAFLTSQMKKRQVRHC